jgi:solute carrier family 15 (peptide/histidine transporter), member 3/4
MVLALIIFLLGTGRYRFYVIEKHSPFARLGRTFISLAKTSLKNCTARYKAGEDVDRQNNKYVFQVFSLCISWFSSYLYYQLRSPAVAEYTAHTVSEIEEARSILRLFPIWATSLVYGVIFAQLSTFFTKQTKTLDRHLTSSLIAPPAALQSLGSFLAYTHCI